MARNQGSRVSMAALQEADYGVGRDYAHGSPHLTHARLRAAIEFDLRSLVEEVIASKGACRALEIGAGHGVFTATLRDAGASVVVTEMSRPSAEVLRARFASDASVRVVYDPDAVLAEDIAATGFDLLVYISVLHHIPDYLRAVEKLVALEAPGGAFYSTQDPVRYRDRTWLGRKGSRLAYLLWRVRQGQWRRGLATLSRRRKGVFDEENPADMVEYHVVREGVDQNALRDLLSCYFDDVTLRTFWTTQDRILQRIGAFLPLRSDFKLIGRSRMENPRKPQDVSRATT